MSQGHLHLQLKMKELEMWKVELLKVKAPLAVGQALYIVWSEENKRGKTKRHPFQGDVRIVRKMKSENRKTIFMYKDGKTMSIPTADVPKHITSSNTLLSSPLDKIVLAKKLAHAEEHALASDADSDEEEDGEEEEDEEEDLVEEDVEDNVDNESRGILSVPKTVGGSEMEPTTLGGSENASKGVEETETTDPNSQTTLTGAAAVGDSETAATSLGGSEKAGTTVEDAGGTTDPKSQTTLTGAVAVGDSKTPATTLGGSEKAGTTVEDAGGTTDPNSQKTLTGAMAAGEPANHVARALYNPPPPPQMFGKVPSLDNAAMDATAFEIKMRELREAEAKVKAAKKIMSTWKKESVSKSTMRAEKKRLEEQLKKVKLEVKKETAATKLQVQESRNKRKRMDDMDSDADSASDDNDVSDKPQKKGS